MARGRLVRTYMRIVDALADALALCMNEAAPHVEEASTPHPIASMHGSQLAAGRGVSLPAAARICSRLLQGTLCGDFGDLCAQT